MEKINTVPVALAKFITSLSLIDPEGWTTAETPAWTNFSIPSTNGKKASDAATISVSKFLIFFILSIAIWQLSSLLGWPEPIPTVVLLSTKTIALDFTYLQTLKANIKLSNCILVGFFFETILKSFLENIFLSSDCIKIELLRELNLNISFCEKLDASISLKFFFDFNILSAFFSNPLATITSRKILLSSRANFLSILKLQDTIPPKALVGSQAKAAL